jgi:calcium-dependent protein kinase
MKELFQASDVDGSGQIDYSDFLAAMLDSNRVARRKEAVRKSFEELDRDGDGFITAEDIVKARPVAWLAVCTHSWSSMIACLLRF